MQPEEEKSNRIEELEKRLYSKDETRMPRRRIGVLHPVKHQVSGEWKETPHAEAVFSDVPSRAPVFKKFFIFSILFFIVALGFGAYMFFGNSGSVSIDNVSIDVLGSTFTAGGESLPLQVEISNKNSVALEYADLLIEYPKGSDPSAGGGDVARDHISLGSIAPGAVAHERVSVQLFGEQGSVKDVKFSVQFRVTGSNAVFQKARAYGITINSAPVTLAVDMQKTTSPNQDLPITINLTPNADKSISNMVVKIDYPTGFQFKNATPAPSYLSNVWRVDKLDPGVPFQIKINGTILGENGEERSFRVYTGVADSADKNTIGVILASSVQTLTIERPFLDAEIVINGVSDKETVVLSPRSMVHAEVRYKNNLPNQILNAEITAKLSGELIDKSSVQPGDGFYSSTDGSIVWDKATNPGFSSLSPGQTGVLYFTFETLSPVKSDRTLSSDPTIRIELGVKGQQSTGDVGAQTVSGSEKKTIRFSTDFQVAGDVFRSIGPFVNSGPFPPKADNKTTYTVRWALTTSINPVSDITVRASMPPSVHFLGNISPTSEDLALDPITGDIMWKVPSLSKGTGLISDPRIVYFQIEFTPSLSQTGTVPVLINETKADGRDTGAEVVTSSKWKALTTKIVNDPTYAPGMEQVIK